MNNTNLTNKDIYFANSFSDIVKGNSYVGRGIVLGKTADGNFGVAAYFIMGRSQNSRNRVFVDDKEGIKTDFFDSSKGGDPSLVIYYPVRQLNNQLIVTNGDQTDTVYDYLKKGDTFQNALLTREFEPDKPNFTPRISGMMTFTNQDCPYTLSILKSADKEGNGCNRFFYEYSAQNGVGHFLHTYLGDGQPLPTFCGEPHLLAIGNDIDAFAKEIWQSLDPDNKISLYVRFTDLKTMECQKRLINKYTK